MDLTKVTDLSPLKNTKIDWLIINRTGVDDLTPLKGLKLKHLSFSSTPVADLSPLQGMMLDQLRFRNTRVTDLSPLRGMPLREIECDVKIDRDSDLLRSIKTLEKINSQPVAEFWKAPGMSSLAQLAPATPKAAARVPDKNPEDGVTPVAKGTAGSAGASAPALVRTLAMGKIPPIFGSRWTSPAERVVDRDLCHDDACCTSTSFGTAAILGVRWLEHADKRAG